MSIEHRLLFYQYKLLEAQGRTVRDLDKEAQLQEIIGALQMQYWRILSATPEVISNDHPRNAAA